MNHHLPQNMINYYLSISFSYSVQKHLREVADAILLTLLFFRKYIPPPHHCNMHGGGFLCDRNKEVGREITAPPHMNILINNRVK